jgi:hypothetical protein
MAKRNKIFLAAILVLFTALIVIRHFAPKPVDWRLNFSGNRRSPYGCSVAKELLPVLFPGKEISVNTANFYLTLRQDTIDKKNLIIINDEFNPDDLDLTALLAFAARGNSVFISSLSFTGRLCDTLKFKTNMPAIDTSMLKRVKEELRLSYSATAPDSVFFYKKMMPDSRFESYDTLNTVTLGRDKSGNVNFILTRFGKGEIFIHCQPLAFTNFHLLYGNYRYGFTALSHLPVENTIWDQYYKPEKIIDLSPVRYILSQPALKAAYFMLVFTIIVYMIFGSKRMQRIIPVIGPEINTSLDFVTTVGKLYYRSRNHSDLARKKLIYFKEFIRNRYFIQAINSEKIITLSQKSGVEEEKIRHLITIAGNISGKTQITRQELAELHQSLEDFYKNCK